MQEIGALTKHTKRCEIAGLFWVSKRVSKYGVNG